MFKAQTDRMRFANATRFLKANKTINGKKFGEICAPNTFKSFRRLDKNRKGLKLKDVENRKFASCVKSRPVCFGVNGPYTFLLLQCLNALFHCVCY